MVCSLKVSKCQKEIEPGPAIWELDDTIENAFRAAVLNLGCPLNHPGDL